MRETILHLNYVQVLVVGVAGFMVGWLWFSPVLFAKAWMTEMKFGENYMEEAKQKGMASYFIRGFLYTLLGTFGLAVLLRAHGSATWLNGALFGAFVGLFLPAMRMLNGSVWENRSMKLLAILVGHEVTLFTVQGAILGAWR